MLSYWQEEGLGELEVLDLLARKRVKGRGAIGSRADEPGPFLPNSRGACMLSVWCPCVAVSVQTSPCRCADYCVWLFCP